MDTMNTTEKAKQELMNRIVNAKHVNLEEEKALSLQLLEHGHQNQDSYAIAFAHTYLSDYHILCRNHEACLYHLQEALSLAEEYHYQDLLLLLYIIAGIYHSSHFDEVSAVQNYLSAYNLAVEENNLQQQMVVLNNLSSLFYQKEDYQEALAYSEHAYQVFQEQNRTTLQFIDLIIITNFIQLLISNKRIKEAIALYEQYEDKMLSQMKKYQVRDLIIACQLHLAYAHQQKTIVLEKIDSLLTTDTCHTANKDMYFTLLYDIFEILLDYHDFTRCEQIYLRMDTLCQREDVDQNLKLLLSKIRFAETFTIKDMLPTVYKEYYLLQKTIHEITNKTKATSMKEKVMVSHLMKEKDQITKEKIKLEAQVKVDDLTGLYNRNHFNQLLEIMRENEEIESLAFILIDIDHFKEYNDYYGHYQGDELLKKIAHCINEHCDTQFFPARYGCDEFICLCVNVDACAIECYLERVLTSLEHEHVEHKANKVCDIATISCGYAIFPNDDTFVYKNALMITDAALYCAKTSGRNQFKHL